MALTFTPGQFAERSEFYRQLAQLTSAGLGLIAGLQQLQQHPPARSYRDPIRRLLADLHSGCTFSDALQRLGNWLPEFDLALIRAGEHSGRLDAAFRLLADYYGERLRMSRQMLTDLLYPLALFHFAVFIFPFPALFLTGNWIGYLEKTLGILLPIYLVVFAIIYAGQGQHGERWRSILEHMIRPVPVLGTARFYLALGRLASSLEALLSAGVNIVDAWELASAASGSPGLRRTVFGWRRLLDAGQTPAEAVLASGRFPPLFSGQYATGELSGTLDETLSRLHRYYLDEGTRKLRAFVMWLPRAVYLGIVLMIAYKVVTFWTGYFKQLQSVF
jgi:type II secretory pathway component PulF